MGLGIRGKVLTVFSVIFAFIMVVGFVLFSRVTSYMCLEYIRRDMHDVLRMALEEIDRENFLYLTQTTEMDEHYWQHVTYLAQLMAYEPDSRIYTYTYADCPDGVMFIGSSGALDNQGAEFREIWHSSGNLVLGLQQPVDNLQPYEDAWGRWVSTYAPLEYEGQVVGAVGVDFVAQQVLFMHRQILVVMAVVAVVLYILSALIIYCMVGILLQPIGLLKRLLDGKQVNIDSLVSRFPDEFAQLLLSYLRMQKQVDIHIKQLQHLTSRLAQVSEQERRCLAQELHDGVGSELTSLQLKTGVLAKTTDVTQLQTGIRRISSMLRQVMHDLYPVELKAGLPAALKWYVQNQPSLNIELEVIGEIALPPEVEAALFRIAQEALHNVVQHAQATRAKVVLSDHCLVISDNGQGIERVDETPPRFGMLTMRERALAIGATMDVDVGCGTTVRIEYDSSSIG